MALPKRIIFWKIPKGGGGHFQSKNLYCIFWTFKQGFLSMKMLQKGHFRVQGMFFQQLYWEKSKQDTLSRRHFWTPPPFGNVTKIHPFWWRQPSLYLGIPSILTICQEKQSIWYYLKLENFLPQSQFQVKMTICSNQQSTCLSKPVHMGSFMALLVPVGHASVAMCHKICAGR